MSGSLGVAGKRVEAAIAPVGPPFSSTPPNRQRDVVPHSHRTHCRTRSPLQLLRWGVMASG